MLLTVGLFAGWGLSVMAIPLVLMVPFLVAAVVIDWRHMLLADDLNLSIAILAVLYVILSCRAQGWDGDVFYDAAFASFLLFGLMYGASCILSKIKGRQALGQGDLKFLPAAGLVLGLQALPYYLALSGILGILTALIKGRDKENGAFPFGPALIISLYIHVFLTGLGFDYTW